MLAETICSAVSAAGLGLAAVTAYRKRFLAATRIAAYALVPVALVMTGFVEWVSGMVFDPTVWAGFGLLGLSWVLFMT
ncbi:membrane protein, partial [Streptomyces sp. NRRL S-444]